MSTWQNLLKIFYQYKTNIILYVKGKKLKGFILRDHFTENLSDIDSINQVFDSFVIAFKDIDQALMYLEHDGIIHEGRQVVPVVNQKFNFIGLWNRLNIIKSLEDIPLFDKNDILEKNEDQSSFNHKLAMLALEVLPIGMLALDTSGNQLLYNEDWLALKKKYPRELKTKHIIQCAKEAMANEVHKPEVNFAMTFSLDKIIDGHIIKMKLICNANTTIGYLFWNSEINLISQQSDSSIKETSSYEGKSLKEILHEKEKQILSWALKRAKGKVSDAAKILKVPRQTFSYRYARYHKQKN